MGNVHRFWGAAWATLALPREIVVVSPSPRGLVHYLAIIFFIALALHTQPAHALDAKDFTDVTLRTGSQLKGRLDDLYKQPNVSAAIRYFEERKLLPQADGLAEVRFRTISTNENYNVFFIPFAEPRPIAGLTHLAVSAEGPKGSKVVVGTISTEGQEAVVKEENVIVDGKVQPPQPNQAFLKSWLKCSLQGCVGALGCAVSGPGWPACMCLSCGAIVITCGITEYLFQ